MKQRKKEILLLFSGLLVALGLGEVTVRGLDLPPKMMERLPVGSFRLSSDPVLRYEYIPNFRPGQMAYDESHSYFRINSDGFRDGDFTSGIQPEDIRVVVLGDSVTVGNGIRDVNETYAKQLEKLLNRGSTRKRYQVWNLAVAGYDTLQEAETLRLHIKKLRPDIVLIGFCVNDFWQVDGGIEEKLQWYKVSTGAFGWTEALKKPILLLEYLSARSRLLFFLQQRIGAKLNSLKRAPVLAYTYRGIRFTGQDRVDLGLRLITQLQSDYRFEAVLFAIPCFNSPFSKYGQNNVRNSLYEVAKHYPSIKVVDLLDRFRSLTDEARQFAQPDGLHPNIHGHKIIAQFMHEALLKSKNLNLVHQSH